MPQADRVTGSLDRALGEATGSIVRDVIADLPEQTRVGELIDGFLGSRCDRSFRELTIDDLLGASGLRASVSRPRSSGTAAGRGREVGGRSPDTRTVTGREALDAAVAEFLEAAGEAGAEDVRARVGGNPNQIRRSLKRLVDAGSVARSGEKRATRYRWRAAPSRD